MGLRRAMPDRMLPPVDHTKSKKDHTHPKHKSFRGNILVYTGRVPGMHPALVTTARTMGTSVNKLVTGLIDEFLRRNGHAAYLDEERRKWEESLR